MAGVVSLLDEASEQVVRALWAELAERHTLREVARRVPHPHCSYHVAEDYDLTRLRDALGRVAAQTRPFAATLTGLGAFTAPEPVLYLAVERTAALDALHAAIWRELALLPGVARAPMAVYAASSWIPHVTLAQGDLTPAALDSVLAAWAGRDLGREVWVNNVTLLARAADASTSDPLLRVTLGGAAGG